jgi:hypothetical protein
VGRPAARPQGDRDLRLPGVAPGRERFTQYIPAAERLALRAAREIAGEAGRDAESLLLRIGFVDDRRTAPA